MALPFQQGGPSMMLILMHNRMEDPAVSFWKGWATVIMVLLILSTQINQINSMAIIKIKRLGSLLRWLCKELETTFRQDLNKIFPMIANKQTLWQISSISFQQCLQELSLSKKSLKDLMVMLIGEIYHQLMSKKRIMYLILKEVDKTIIWIQLDRAHIQLRATTIHSIEQTILHFLTFRSFKTSHLWEQWSQTIQGLRDLIGLKETENLKCPDSTKDVLNLQCIMGVGTQWMSKLWLGNWARAVRQVMIRDVQLVFKIVKTSRFKIGKITNYNKEGSEQCLTI